MYEYKCNITRVVDGDTVDAEIDCGFDIVFKSRIRLYGIDSPESRTRDKEEKVKGLAAKEWLSKEFYDAVDPIELQSHGKGKFGRILGEFFINGININQSMIDNGHAVEYHGGKR